MKKLIIITGVIGLAAWQVMYNDSLSNALLALILGGQLPLSHTIVPPQIAIGIVTGILFLIVLELLMRFAPRASQPARPRYVIDPPSAAQPASIITTATPSVSPATKTMSAYAPFLYRRGNEWRIRRRVWLAHQVAIYTERLHAMPIILNATSRRALATISPIIAVCLSASVKSREKLREVSTIALRVGGAAMVHGRHASIQAIREVTKTSKNTWAFVSPYLWRFDHWLELQTRSMRQRVTESFRSYDSLVILMDVVEEMLVSIGFRRAGRP